MKRTKRERCDKCAKWVSMGELYTLPESLHPLLDAENEFCVCEDCTKTVTPAQWKDWIEKARAKGLSFKGYGK